MGDLTAWLSPQVLQIFGISVVLIILLFVLWKKLNSKDKRIDQLVDSLVTKYEENTRMDESVKNSLDKNTEVMSRVLDRFDELMRDVR